MMKEMEKKTGKGGGKWKERKDIRESTFIGVGVGGPYYGVRLVGLGPSTNPGQAFPFS